jgi:hypothetical protein
MKDSWAARSSCVRKVLVRTHLLRNARIVNRTKLDILDKEQDEKRKEQDEKRKSSLVEERPQHRGQHLRQVEEAAQLLPGLQRVVLHVHAPRVQRLVEGDVLQLLHVVGAGGQVFGGLEVVHGHLRTYGQRFVLIRVEMHAGKRAEPCLRLGGQSCPVERQRNVSCHKRQEGFAATHICLRGV